MVKVLGVGRLLRKAVLVAVLAMLLSRAATADVVRHGSIPDSYTGTWIAGAETEPSKSVIVLSAKMYVSSDATCSVDWVSQTAGAHGSIYSAHLQCSSRADKAGAKTVANLIIWPENINRIAVGPEFPNLKSFHRCSATCVAQRNGLLSEGVRLGIECGINVEKCALTLGPHARSAVLAVSFPKIPSGLGVASSGRIIA